MKSINEKAEKAYCDFIEVKKDAIEQIKQSGFNEIVMNIQINRVMKEHSKCILYSGNQYDKTTEFSQESYFTKINKQLAFETSRSAKLYDTLSEFIDNYEGSQMIYSIISLVEKYAELYK